MGGTRGGGGRGGRITNGAEEQFPVEKSGLRLKPSFFFFFFFGVAPSSHAGPGGFCPVKNPSQLEENRGPPSRPNGVVAGGRGGPVNLRGRGSLCPSSGGVIPRTSYPRTPPLSAAKGLNLYPWGEGQGTALKTRKEGKGGPSHPEKITARGGDTVCLHTGIATRGCGPGPDLQVSVDHG